MCSSGCVFVVVVCVLYCFWFYFFFFNDTATTEIYTLSLHDALPISNVRTGAVPSLEEHPLPALVAAGVLCSISTDDPEMFDTDLTREYEAACSLGIPPRTFYDAAVE